MVEKRTNKLPSIKTRWAIGVFLAVAIGLIVLAFSWLAIRPQNTSSETYPLSSEFEYIGEKTTECLLPLCATKLSSTYYYSTDLSIDAVRQLFQGSKGQPETYGLDSESTLYTYSTMVFKDSREKPFTIKYVVDGKDAAIKSLNLSQTTKKNILYISSDDYTTVKGWLKS